MRQFSLRSALAGAFLALSPTLAQPLTTAFTYQGELRNGAALATGNHDLRFRLYDAASGGNQVGTSICLDNVSVAAGRFVTTLDFGVAATDGNRRYLEIDARQDTGLTCATATGFTTLSPRQELTATPYAAYALSTGSAVSATNSLQLNGQSASFYTNASNLVSGTISASRLPSPLTLSGNVLGGTQQVLQIQNTTLGYGVGIASTATGVGIKATSTATTGVTFGAQFESNSDAGTALLATANNGEFGIRGITSSALGTAVSGEATSASGNTSGVYGSSQSPDGIGVFGSGGRMGIGGQAASSGGIGVQGFAPADGHAGYFNGRGYFSGNVGIGTTTPAMKLTVAGDMEMGVNSGDYRRFRIGGGNSNGYLYGSFPGLGDGVHLGYNWYADGAGTGTVYNTGGQTSRISVGYGSIVLATGGVNQPPATRLAIDPIGNTTFNTAFPTQMSFAYNGTLTVPAITLSGGNGSSGESALRINNFNNQQYMYLGALGGAPTRPLMGVLNPAAGTGVLRAGLKCDSTNQGVVFGDVKSFRTENPSLPGTDIVYSCIEGPEAAAYIRGTAHLVNGRAAIDLPQHFRDVALGGGMTVQLTPCSPRSLGLAVVSQSPERIEVQELLSGTGTYDFHWRAEAVRKGFEKYEVIRPTAERTAALPSTPD